jgi:hypothetical protein
MNMAKKEKVTQLPDDDDVESIEEAEVEVNTALSAKAVAQMLGTDGRTLRKFLRLKFGKVGHGNRWVIDPEDVDDIRRGFEEFNKPKPTKEVKVLLAASDDEADEVEDLDDFLAEEIEDLEELEI